MTYRKFRADHLFTGQDFAPPGTVLVTSPEGAIVELLTPGQTGDGQTGEVQAGDDIEYFPGILSPGFINCHCHLELSHMKGLIPEGTGLVDFLLGVMGGRASGQPASLAQNQAASSQGQAREASPGHQGHHMTTITDHRLAIIAAAEEAMLHAGIVAVGDICNTADTLPIKTAGRLYYHNFIETMGFLEHRASDRFALSRKVFEAFAEAYTLPIEANSIVPHAPYSVSPALFRLIADFPGNHLLSIHNQETEAENIFYQTGKGDFLRLYGQMGLDVSFFQGTGHSSLKSILPHFYRNQTLLLVHNVATSQSDLQEALYRQGQGATLYFCLCPNANLYISGQLPDPELLIRNGCQVVLGTDSLASNHQLSILEEMKTLQRHFPQFSTPTLLRWATRNGAEAMQLDGVLGSFTPGKQPGILLIGGTEGTRLTAVSHVTRLL